MSSSLSGVGNVFYFVDDFEKAVPWYSERLGAKPAVEASQLVTFLVNGVRLTIHRADDYDSSGPSGVAAYWTVDSVDAFVAEWTSHGAVVHRGPKTVFTGERLCQLIDPFGNLFCVREEIEATTVAPGPAG
ncbi:VOC family protein [Agreia sp. Leaf210]|uniref:VOC family protein n=1 Tax=Agreia sp. Leaf210 TaxID=1735682 RepID=UPI0006F687BF|nr:VOC family protein [Agreia sp. Leaf210]KQM61015.1 hypothetical protein ASE64_05220 [Agreia sp. Leaf210]